MTIPKSHNIISWAQDHWVEILESRVVAKNDLRLLIRADFRNKGDVCIRHFQVTFVDCLVDGQQNLCSSPDDLLEDLSEKYPGKFFSLYNKSQSTISVLKDKSYKVYRFVDEGYEDERFFVAKAVRVSDVTSIIKTRRRLLSLFNAIKRHRLMRKIRRLPKS